MSDIPRVGIGVDTHRFRNGGRLMLGGVEIPSARGLDGHSDADVLLHAIVDAMLGALALGDIGRHFPDDDSRWKDAGSRVFVAEALRLVEQRGYTVANIDSTVMAESPRLSRHVEDIRTSIANMLDVEVDRVSVKATTAERMGAIGRHEGIVAMAVVGLTPLV